MISQLFLRRAARVLSPLLVLGGASRAMPAQPPPPAASLEARIDGLLKQMTAQEKIDPHREPAGGTEGGRHLVCRRNVPANEDAGT